MNVELAFLSGVLEEEVYLEKPPGYMKIGEEKKVLKLKKALYGLNKRREHGMLISTHTSRRMGTSNVPTIIHFIQRRVEVV